MPNVQVDFLIFCWGGALPQRLDETNFKWQIDIYKKKYFKAIISETVRLQNAICRLF